MEILPESRFVRLTMKPSLLKEKVILKDLNINKEKNYLGVVFQVFRDKLVVKFFNGITGILPKASTPHFDSFSLKEHFHIGQLVCIQYRFN